MEIKTIESSRAIDESKTEDLKRKVEKAFEGRPKSLIMTRKLSGKSVGLGLDITRLKHNFNAKAAQKNSRSSTVSSRRGSQSARLE